MELMSRVTIETGYLVIALSVLAGWIGGLTAAAGVCAGGAMAIVNFRWLSRRVLGGLGQAGTSADAPGGTQADSPHGVPVAGWVLGFGVRFTVLAVAIGAVVASGWAHPVGLVIGFSLLPFTLIGRGLLEGTRRG